MSNKNIERTSERISEATERLRLDVAMKHRKLLSAVLLSVIFLGLAYALGRSGRYAALPTIGHHLADFELTDSDGNLVRSTEMESERYALLFVRVDCDYCHEEVNQLGQLKTALRILPVSLSSENETRLANREWGSRFSFYTASDRLLRALDVRSVPMLVLVDGDGRIAQVLAGLRSKPFLQMVIDRFMSGQSLSESDLRNAFADLGGQER